MKPQIMTFFYLARLVCQRHLKTRAANVWDLMQSDQASFQ